MQWSDEPNAGFTTGVPWLPIGEDYAETNVEVERDDPGSMLTLYRRLIDLRRGEPALEIGRIASVEAEGATLMYTRSARAGEPDFLVALNLGEREESRAMPPGATGTVVLSTHLDREGQPVAEAITIRANEGVVVKLDEGPPSVPGRDAPLQEL
jgi:alpha-glucosidase